MARRTKADAERTRQQLLETALALFSEKGLANVTLAQVASAAGVTRGAIYWHFKDKAEMISALWEQAFQPVSVRYGSLLEQKLEDPLQVLEDISGNFIEELLSNEHLQQVSRLRQQAAYDERVIEVWRKQFLRDQERLCRLMTQVRDRGELRDELTVEEAAMMVFCFLGGIVGRWLLAPEYMQLEERGKNMLAVFFDGLKKKG